MKNTVALVVPCFNEQDRLSRDYFESILVSPEITLMFVNDGSSDSTSDWIQDFCLNQPRAMFLNLKNNLGKAEAVRLGMLSCYEHGFSYIGFLDCDGAFASSDVVRLVNLIANQNLQIRRVLPISVLLSSRIKLSGRQIERSEFRHIIGRLVAAVIGINWKNSPYDSQSGFKIFLSTSELYSAIQETFKTRWFLDVELLLRLQSQGKQAFWEEPVDSWSDVKGSKIRMINYFSILKEIIYIHKIVKSQST